MEVLGFNAEGARRVVKAVRAFEAGPGYGAKDSPRPDAGRETVFAKLTSRDATDKWVYAWSQAVPNPAGWAVESGGLTGTTSLTPAIDIDSHSGADRTNSYVVLVRAMQQEDDGPPTPCWVIADRGPRGFYARVTGATQDGTKKRWTYAFTEVEKSGAGYGHWTDVDEGLTGSAYNLIEDQNNTTGTYGNGVQSSNLTGSLAVQRVPNGTRVRLDPVRRTDDGSIEYWFSYENGIDGGCT